MFISYKFIKRFLHRIFLFFAFSSLNLHKYASMFYLYSKTKFHLDSTKDKEFCHRPQL